MKESEKFGQKQVSQVTLHFVLGSLNEKTNSVTFFHILKITENSSEFSNPS